MSRLASRTAFVLSEKIEPRNLDLTEHRPTIRVNLVPEYPVLGKQSMDDHDSLPRRERGTWAVSGKLQLHPGV